LHRWDWDALIAVHPPLLGAIVGPNPRPDIIFHTMVEANRLPVIWRDAINRTGGVWVPSRFCEQVFRDGGVTVPIFRTGYAVTGTPSKRIPHDGPFRVLAWGDSLASRKNILKVIQTFIDADLPDAILDIKLNLGDFSIPEMTWVDSHGKEYVDIRIRHANWRRDAIQQWLRWGDVGIYLSGGEGYGLMPKEMMATGLPMISVINTGLHEYLDPSLVLHVPSDTLVPSPYFDRTYRESGFVMHEPDHEAAVMHLRWAYEHRLELYAMGMHGAESVLHETWDSIGVAAYVQLLEWNDSHSGK